MNFNGIWNAIEPYVIGALTAFISGGMIFILVKQILSGWLNRNNLDTLAERFANSVVGERIYVDIRALSDKRVKELNEQIINTIGVTLNRNLNVINNITAIVADVGEIFINSKTVSDAQRAKLKEDIEAVKNASGCDSVKSEDCLVVNLALNGNEDKERRIINFD